MLTGILSMGLLVWAAWRPAVLIAIGALLIVLQLLVQLWRHLTGQAAPPPAENS